MLPTVGRPVPYKILGRIRRHFVGCVVTLAAATAFNAILSVALLPAPASEPRTQGSVSRSCRCFWFFRNLRRDRLPSLGVPALALQLVLTSASLAMLFVIGRRSISEMISADRQIVLGRPV
jgi:hypothetical protein